MNRNHGSAWIGLLAMGAVGALAEVASAAPLFSRLYAFGDSLTDSRNFYLASGQPPLPYDQRFSNGPVWVEQLGVKLGTAPVVPSLAGGTNFAFGYARATNAGLGTPIVPSVEEQVGLFLGSGHVPQADELYIVWAGANDLFDGRTDPTPAAAAVVNQVSLLAGAGARNLLVMNLPPIQDTPDLRAESAEIRAGTAAWVGGFNNLLAGYLANAQTSLPAGVNVFQFDTSAFFQEMVADPVSFGLTNVTDRAFTLSPVPSLVSNPEQYLFWDGVHPTTVGHGLLAARVEMILPEPSMGILLIAITGFLSVRQRLAA